MLTRSSNSWLVSWSQSSGNSHQEGKIIKREEESRTQKGKEKKQEVDEEQQARNEIRHLESNHRNR